MLRAFSRTWHTTDAPDKTFTLMDWIGGHMASVKYTESFIEAFHHFKADVRAGRILALPE
jgi:hypothetical protein